MPKNPIDIIAAGLACGGAGSRLGGLVEDTAKVTAGKAIRGGLAVGGLGSLGFDAVKESVTGSRVEHAEEEEE